MKRDMDLVRSVLLEIEGRSWSDLKRPLSIPGYSDETVSYHVMLLHEAGLIEAIDASSRRGLCWIPRSMTWDGHDFLDAAREESRWQSAKRLINDKAGAVTFEVVKQVLVSLAKSQIGL